MKRRVSICFGRLILLVNAGKSSRYGSYKSGPGKCRVRQWCFCLPVPPHAAVSAKHAPLALGDKAVGEMHPRILACCILIAGEIQKSYSLIQTEIAPAGTAWDFVSGAQRRCKLEVRFQFKDTSSCTLNMTVSKLKRKRSKMSNEVEELKQVVAQLQKQVTRLSGGFKLSQAEVR
jgi:hypothetical protein